MDILLAFSTTLMSWSCYQRPLGLFWPEQPLSRWMLFRHQLSQSGTSAWQVWTPVWRLDTLQQASSGWSMGNTRRCNGLKMCVTSSACSPKSVGRCLRSLERRGQSCLWWCKAHLQGIEQCALTMLEISGAPFSTLPKEIFRSRPRTEGFQGILQRRGSYLTILKTMEIGCEQEDEKLQCMSG